MKKVVLVVVLMLHLLGCAGRAANPIIVQQFGDAERSCQALQQEMTFIQSEIQRLIPQTDKTGKNVALGITGFFFLVPLFFMDLSKAEQIEIDAFRQRYNHLVIIANEKKCEIEGEEIPEFDKTPEATPESIPESAPENDSAAP